jgi:HEPN domain-containing protein
MRANDYMAWVQYAHNDLSVAIREMERKTNPRQRPLEVVLYHCQQAAEKMLKAYLVYNGVPVFTGSQVWGHDLNALRTHCASHDKGFTGIRIEGHCSFLHLFAAVRYPDFAFSVDASHATRGINSAKRVYDFVATRIGLQKEYFP